MFPFTNYYDKLYTMLQILINYATLIAFLTISVDLMFQISRIHKRKSSLDISIKGTLVRLFGAAIFTLKYFVIKDFYLILGQLLFMGILMVYIISVLYYSKNNQGLQK